MMRKLASIQKIVEIKSIPDADRIVAYRINGWWVVDSKDKYSVDDLVVYIEPDAWVPFELAPFLSKGKEPRVFNSVPGEKLRTIKLKKQLSQGLLLPIDILPFEKCDDGQELSEFYFVGHDVTEMLGIQKWEAEVPTQLRGLTKGNFPSKIPKTDQERIQNIPQEIEAAKESGLTFEVTEKLEGSSMTCYLMKNDDNELEFGVCSRNLDLKKSEENSFWKVAIKNDIENKLRSLGKEFAIQGELVGPGVQGNIYNLPDLNFYVFDIYNIEEGVYLTPKERLFLIDVLDLSHAPVIFESASATTIDEMLTLADGKSVLGSKPNREGLVWKEVNGGMSFKTISNVYLLGEK